MSVVTRDLVKTMNGWTDSTYDARIDALIPVVETRIGKICNNNFLAEPDYVTVTTTTASKSGTAFAFTNADSKITNTDAKFVTAGFAVGDDIYVQDSYKNDGFFEISAITETVITVTSLYTIIDEDIGNDILLSMVRWPKDLAYTAAEMIRYDIIDRYKTSGIKSESIGDYSVTFGTTDSAAMGAFGYPVDVIGGLELYRKPIFT